LKPPNPYRCQWYIRVRAPVPQKQGLKPSVDASQDIQVLNVRAPVPQKQGLKLAEATYSRLEAVEFERQFHKNKD